MMIKVEIVLFLFSFEKKMPLSPESFQRRVRERSKYIRMPIEAPLLFFVRLSHNHYTPLTAKNMSKYAEKTVEICYFILFASKCTKSIDKIVFF